MQPITDPIVSPAPATSPNKSHINTTQPSKICNPDSNRLYQQGLKKWQINDVTASCEVGQDGDQPPPIRISTKEIHKAGSHFRKHGRDMGLGSIKEYDNAAREFANKHQTNPKASVIEGRLNCGEKGKIVIQRAITYEGKTVIIDVETGQIKNFYRMGKNSALVEHKTIRRGDPEAIRYGDLITRVRSLSKTQFHESLHKTGLTKSYNSCHPDNPAPKGPGGGEIGGVGCKVESIEGLFDTPESLFESEHSFFIPEFQGENIPFTSQEMRQILQELARGIYIHGSVPFFSLHFNQDTDLYPIIHPAYENTLVGQVFSMLDYFMKGYLNGGVFKESFVQKWQENPVKIEVNDTVLKELINFKKYAELNLTGNDQKYYSVRFYLNYFKSKTEKKVDDIQKSNLTSGFNFYDHTKFNNSFRIIAKQNSIEKTEGLFRINSDFEVLYTIEPDPDYKKALNEYLIDHGQYPEAYLQLIQSYEHMKKKIHDHMVKMPLCKKYFAMLGVINFFCYYLTTLKKHRKMPILPDVSLRNAKCPSLFPSLPLFTLHKEELRINKFKVMERFINENWIFINWYLTTDRFGPSVAKIEQVKTSIGNLIWEEVLSNASTALKKEIFKDENKYRMFCKKLAATFDILDLLKTNFNQHYNGLPPSLIGFTEGFSDAFKRLHDHYTPISRLTFQAFILPSEQNPEEIENGKKIVGGCGMNVSPLKIEPSPVGQELLDHFWTNIQETPAGEWTVIKDNGTKTKGVVFTLPFMDIPLGYMENSADLEMLLTSFGEETNSFFDEMHALIRSMAESDEEEFMKLITGIDVNKMRDHDQRSLLHHSVMLNNPYFTNELLKRGCSVTAKDHKNYLPIHYAAMSGNLLQLKTLIKENKKTVEAKSNQGATPLIVASQHGQYDAVELLISEGAAVDVRLNDGYTALHCAVYQGNVKIVELILKNIVYKENPYDRAILPYFVDHRQNYADIATNEGITPLMIACQRGSFPMVEHLRKEGANVNQTAKNGSTALEIAVKKNRLDLCQLIGVSALLTPTIIEIAIKKGSLEINKFLAGLKGILTYVNYVNPLKETSLLLAIKYANIPLAIHILSLINNQATLDAENYIGETPVLLAIQGKFYSLLEELLKRKVNITPIKLFKLLLETGYTGENKALNSYLEIDLTESELIDLTLIAAQAGNHVAISNLLLPRKIDLSKIQGDRGWTIDHYIAKSDGIFLFRMRQHSVKNLNLALKEEEGKTLAYIAGENGSLRVLEYILNQLKAVPNSFNNHYKGRHLFYSVLEKGGLEGIRLFVSKMQNLQFLNQPIDSTGTLPVHLAVKHCGLEVCEYLYSCGANFSVVDSLGHYPLFYAIERKNNDLIKFLTKDKHSNPLTADSIYAAASLKKDKIFQTLISAGADLNDKSNPEQNSALFYAIMQRDFRAFSRLIQHGASLTLKNRDGWTPLLLACREGRLEMVNIILAKNPQTIQDEINGNNALHIACQQGHEHCVDMLVKKGLSADVQNSEGQTAFYFAKKEIAIEASLDQKKAESYLAFAHQIFTAIKENNLSLIPEILNSWQVNSFFTIHVNEVPIRGTLLHFVLSQFKHCDELQEFIIKIINTKDFNSNIRDAIGNSYAHLMLINEIDPTEFKIFDLKAVNNRGQTPLHIAVTQKKELLKKIIQQLPNELDPIDHRKRTPLFYAIKAQEYENVSLLVESGVNIQHSDYQGMTPLIMACKVGHYPIVRTLIKYHANVNQSSIDGSTPLSVSLGLNDEDVILFLIFNGAKLSGISIDGKQVAHTAASKGQIHLLRFLFEQRLLLSPSDKNGVQPIHEAAAWGKINIMEYYTSLGMSIETPMQSTGKEKEINKLWIGSTPIFSASMKSTVEAVKWLLDHQANPRITLDSGLNILQAAIYNEPGNCLEILRLFQEHFLTSNIKQILPAVSLAISKDYIEPIKLFYQMGIPIDTNLEHGFTGMHLACYHGARFSTEFLLMEGAKWDVLSESGETPIELAALNKSVEQFKLMLEYTAPPLDRQNQKGETLMHLAAQAGNLSHIMLLIDQGANFDLQDFQGQTPLHFAAAKGFKDVIKLLMICGANPDIKTIYHSRMPEDVENAEIRDLFLRLRLLRIEAPKGSTPVHIASKAGESLILRLAVHHFDVNQKNCLGRTALHEAVLHGSLENIRTLLSAGADINEKDNEGITPLNMAYLKTSPNIALVLLKTKDLKMRMNR